MPTVEFAAALILGATLGSVYTWCFYRWVLAEQHVRALQKELALARAPDRTDQMELPL